MSNIQTFILIYWPEFHHTGVQCIWHGSQATLTHVLVAIRHIHKHWWHQSWNQGLNLWPGPGLKPMTYHATAQHT